MIVMNDNANMRLGEIDMMDDTVSEELDDIGTPNWQEEVRIDLYLYRKRLLIIIV